MSLAAPKERVGLCLGTGQGLSVLEGCTTTSFFFLLGKPCRSRLGGKRVQALILLSVHGGLWKGLPVFFFGEHTPITVDEGRRPDHVFRLGLLYCGVRGSSGAVEQRQAGNTAFWLLKGMH